MAADNAAAEAELARLERLVRLLDESIEIPGTGYHIGLDALVGLVPAAGDALMALVSLYIVWRGQQLGARKRTVTRMLWNVVVDLLVGTVPVAGDVFDAWWKANLRNLELLRADLARGPRR